MSRLHQMQSRTNYSENSLMIKDTLMNIFINNEVRFGKKNIIGKYLIAKVWSHNKQEKVYMIYIYKSIRFLEAMVIHCILAVDIWEFIKLHLMRRVSFIDLRFPSGKAKSL